MTLKQACSSEYQGAQGAFKDSMIHGKSAIHITYRDSLRSSSMREPRDPLLKVVFLYIYIYQMLSTFCRHASQRRNAQVPKGPLRMGCTRVCQRVKTKGFGGTDLSDPPLHPRGFDNDPSAGSPTETLLRLLLPLNDQV